MMERHLQDPELWEQWLALLARHPGEEAELDARASLLVERYVGRLGVEQAVHLAMERAALVHEALAMSEEAPPRSSSRRWWQAAGVAAVLAAGVLVGVMVPGADEGVTWRGEVQARPALAWGTVQVEQGRRSLGRSAVGRGVRPTLQVSEGPLVVRWNTAERPEGHAAWVWLADGAGRVLTAPVPLRERVELAVGSEARALVVAFGPQDADPAEIAATVRGGREAVEPLGSVQVVAFDLDRP